MKVWVMETSPDHVEAWRIWTTTICVHECEARDWETRLNESGRYPGMRFRAFPYERLPTP